MMSNDKKVMLPLEPRDEVVFEGPFEPISLQCLVIGNPSKIRSVAFKLNTTNPRMFVLHYNIGVLGPIGKVSGEIFLKPSPNAGQKDHMILMVLGNLTDLDKFCNVWYAEIKCEIVPYKQTGLQTGGDATGSPDPAPDGETEFEIQEVIESVDKVLREVSKVKDENLFLIEQVRDLRVQIMLNNRHDLMIRRAHKGKKNIFFVGLSMLSILSAIAIYYGKQYF